MARVQLIVPDEDKERFVRQAQREGMTFSAWLRAAAHARLEERRGLFSSAEDVWEFFRQCDAAADGPEREPDWAEHLATLDAARRSGAGAP